MVVVGSGPAGEKGATQAAYFGKRVAIVERNDRPGGATVANAGIPTKTLRETALYLTGFGQRDVYGVSLALSEERAVERLQARRRQITAAMSQRVRDNLDRHGIELIHGDARLEGDRKVVVRQQDGRTRTLSGDVVLIATGSRPLHPPGIPFDDPDVMDSEKVLAFDRIPGDVVVVGGGAVGCEYASILTALGANVTLVDAGPRLLPFLDAEISDLLANAFAEMGTRLVLGSGAAEIARRDGRLEVRLASGEIISPEAVLFAAGRVGNTDGLGLDRAGVEVDARGRVVVDGEFRTTADGIYAAGDVIGPPALASVSMEQGRVAVCHAFGISFKETVDPLAPFGVYSIPEAAMAGLTEEAAQKEGLDYEVGRGPFAENTRANIAGQTAGLVKLVFRRDDRRLLGVHILGDEAAELLHLGQAVMHANATIDQFIDATFNVPTRTEAYKYAAYDGLQRLSGRRLSEAV